MTDEAKMYREMYWALRRGIRTVLRDLECGESCGVEERLKQAVQESEDVLMLWAEPGGTGPAAGVDNLRFE